MKHLEEGPAITVPYAAIVIVLAMVLQGCGSSFPPEIAAGHALSVRMAKANLETRARMADAYGTSIRQGHEKQLQLIMERELLRAQDRENPGLVPAARVRELMELADVQRRKAEADLLAERAKWTADPNLVQLVRLLESLNLHSQSIDAWARQVDRLAAAAGILPQNPPNPPGTVREPPRP